MVAAFALLFAHQGSTITVESPGITVAAFCDELSKQTGKTYTPLDEIRNDLLAIHLTNAPAEDVVKRLLFTERATIDFDGKTDNIRPDEAARAKLRAEELAERIKKIKSTQDRVRGSLRSTPLDAEQSRQIAQKFTELTTKEKTADDANNQNASVGAWLQKEDQALRLPTGNALLRFFLSIPAEELAAVPPDTEAVWSTSPTATERPCPVDPQALLAGFRADQQTWNDESPKWLSGDAGKYIANTGHGGEKPVTLIRFELGGGRGAQFVIQLTGFDADGKVEFEIVQETWTPKNMDDSAKWAAGAKDKEPTPMLAPFSRPTARLISLWSAYPNAAELATWKGDSEFLNMFFNPDKFDPVAETFGRVVLELAKAKNEQLIASENVSMAMLLPENSIARGKLNLATVEKSFEDQTAQKFTGLEFDPKDGWITIRPASMDTWREREFDRAALAKLYRTARDEHKLTLMDVAHFAADQNQAFGPPSLRGVELLKIAVPDLVGYELLIGGDWPMKSFLGRLDETQITYAQQPNGLGLASCTAAQLEPLVNTFRFARFNYKGLTDVWHSYPTDAIPNGLPGNGVLNLSIDSGSALKARIGDPGDYVDTRFYSPEELGDRLVKKPEGRKWRSYNLLGVTPQNRQTYIFNFDFPEQTSLVEKLNDYIAVGKEVLSLDQLPEPLRSQAKSAMEKGAK